MIPKNKDHPVNNDPGSGSNFLSLNRGRNRLQKYWAHVILYSMQQYYHETHDITQILQHVRYKVGTRTVV